MAISDEQLEEWRGRALPVAVDVDDVVDVNGPQS